VDVRQQVGVKKKDGKYMQTKIVILGFCSISHNALGNLALSVCVSLAMYDVNK